jgi:hypothetical protein
MKKLPKSFIIAALLFTLLTPLYSIADSSGSILDIGSHRELFVDNYLIDKMDGTRLRMHSPVSAGKVLEFDKPWEGRYCGYITTFTDGDRFRLYYRGLPESGKDGSNNEVTCYAESRDGIHWNKPNLGIYEINGSTNNNVVLKDMAPLSHNFSPFLDAKPDVPDSQRFKALAGTEKSGLVGFVSADGLHWKKIRQKPLITQGVFDSQNVAFWSQSESCYVCYFRTWSGGGYKGYRTVSRCTSPDFINWSDPVAMTFGDTPMEHLYTSQTHSYFRAPHIYIAYPARFMPGRKVLTKEQFAEIGGEAKYAIDCSETCFMSSRGGNRYNRTFMEGFIRPGLGINNWSSRTNYTACGTIPNSANQMSLYIQRNYGQPTHYLERLTLRTDGFASINAPFSGGAMTTKPFRFQGEKLTINFSTSAAGSIWVEIQDQDGQTIPGFSKNDCDEIIGDQIKRTVTWKGNPTINYLSGKAIRLKFVMKDADIYSIKFE